MAQVPSSIQGETLIYQQGEQFTRVVVGSSDWYRWLETASSFTFHSEIGSFTAHKERAGNKRGDLYWRAYRKREGKLHRVYLGKSDELTLERLQTTAALLANTLAREKPRAVSEQIEDTKLPLAESSHKHARVQFLTQTASNQKATRPTDRPKSRPFFNLPITPTPLIGREQERTAIRALLQSSEGRLLTLTGTGGVGKTRLSLEIARVSSGDFTDGICFVGLAATNDSTRVLPLIAQGLGLWEAVDRPLLEQVQDYLRERHLLLLLDNFEQVITAAPLLERLLTSCPHLQILITSRAPLHLSDEREFVVSPLAVPPLSELPALTTLSQVAAVRLFVVRAQAVQANWQLTRANAPIVAEICTRLGGLPLAVELAAARIRLLPPRTLLKRLEQPLDILTRGADDLPRQRTMRNTIQWSYDLLTSDEQRLFRRLSIFVGGFTLQDAEALCATFPSASDADNTVLDNLTSLVENNLIQPPTQDEENPRLDMLQVVREYGLERLQGEGEAEYTRQMHALYYLDFAERAEVSLKGKRQSEWLTHLDGEQENLRAALRWSIDCQKTSLALRFCSALWWFWLSRGELREGHRWLETTLNLPSDLAETKLRARALCGAGHLAFRLDENTKAREWLEESVALCRQGDDQQTLIQALAYLGESVCEQGNVEAGRTLLQESVALARQIGDLWLCASSLLILGRVIWLHGNHAGARAHIEESLLLFQRIGDKQGISRASYRLSGFLLDQGDLMRSIELMRQSLALAREINDRVNIVLSLCQLGYQIGVQGDRAEQTTLLEEGLVLAHDIGYKAGTMTALSYLAQAAQLGGDFTRAAQFAQECLALVRETGKIRNITFTLYTLGCIVRDQGNLRAATDHFKEGLALAQQIRYPLYIGWNLVGLATIAAIEHRPWQAAHLFGATEDMLANEMRANPHIRGIYEQYLNEVRSQLGEETFVSAQAKGREMTPEQILEIQELAVRPPSSRTELPFAAKTVSEANPTRLTAREIEVLYSLSQGLTDAQIAEKLIISPRTVNTHLISIYSKLGVNSRTAATRFAFEHQLLV
jgi:predicted ATPase/DNA-binding CsgD family transcriptional regulator